MNAFVTAFFCNLCLFFMLQGTAQAHQLSTSYINLNAIDDSHFTGSWQINVADLEQQVAFDLNQDGAIAWHEISAKHSAISDFVLTSLTVTSADEQVCTLTSDAPLQLDSHFNQPYVVVKLQLSCPALDTNHSAIAFHYQAFFDTDANHKAIVTINEQTRVMSKNNALQTFDFTKSSYLTTFNQYVYQGVLHIWLGLDHILFLIALLLTCVLVKKSAKWQGVESKVTIFKHTAWIVTAFTLAHSITLTATAMQLVTPNSRWVELGIAISVLFAALNNIWPLVVRLGWVTFAFGLLHGMGFASVLGELGLSSDYQLLSVLAFNLGVEIGQLAILAVTLPVLIWARNYHWYQKWVMPAGSLAIAIIAVQWSMERI
ncbi:HupE/UreJ family protein [Pseudoalteromonas sp. SG41-1]|uniref:HupE/UreJ family protein n=1 Tax=Pseudoalteromonas sp. SG41-1 TaxID=2760979 RepID=UPI001601248B|nr:HupE/UreJ family protein [Pseudoalteromonas sp. SG41-1]MBB1504264.1 HupE/UreJ family protein [Pseudoalteromonas sp. SG41-1]